MDGYLMVRFLVKNLYRGFFCNPDPELVEGEEPYRHQALMVYQKFVAGIEFPYRCAGFGISEEATYSSTLACASRSPHAGLPARLPGSSAHSDRDLVRSSSLL